jgi:hypothetical protein
MTLSRSFYALLLGGAYILFASSSPAANTNGKDLNAPVDSGTALMDSAGRTDLKASAGQPSRSGDSKASDEKNSAPKELAPESALGGEAALSRNLALYESGQYEACVVGLREILDTPGGTKLQRPELIDQAETYLGACLVASGQPELADQVFARAIRNNPQMRAPDNLVFPQTVVDRFLRVREKLLTDIRRDERNRVQDAEHRARERDAVRRREIWVTERLRELAMRESVAEKNRRWLAFVPFGVGQFQNSDNTAGAILLGVESVLLGTCITAIVIDEHLANRSRDVGIDTHELDSKRTDAYRVIVASSWSMLGVMAGGIVHANLRFVPERRMTRLRSLPQSLSAPTPANSGQSSRKELSPSVSVSPISLPSGYGMGLVGEF